MAEDGAFEKAVGDKEGELDGFLDLLLEDNDAVFELFEDEEPEPRLYPGLSSSSHSGKPSDFAM